MRYYPNYFDDFFNDTKKQELEKVKRLFSGFMKRMDIIKSAWRFAVFKKKIFKLN